MKAQSRSRNGQFKQTNRRRPKTPQPAMMPPKLYREDTRETATSPGYSLRVYEGPQSFARHSDRVFAELVEKVVREHPEYDGGDVISVVATRLADKYGEHISSYVARVGCVYQVVCGKSPNPLSTHLLLVGSD